jgi:hypothetical protein
MLHVESVVQSLSSHGGMPSHASATVTEKVQLSVNPSPAVSSTLMVTSVVPTLKYDPEAWLDVSENSEP